MICGQARRRDTKQGSCPGTGRGRCPGPEPRVQMACRRMRLMAGYDGGTFRIDFEWKEVVHYREGDDSHCFPAGWGVVPPVLYVPSAERWDRVVPAWLVGRRDQVVARLAAHSGHRLQDE